MIEWAVRIKEEFPRTRWQRGSWMWQPELSLLGPMTMKQPNGARLMPTLEVGQYWFTFECKSPIWMKLEAIGAS
jgi:hypothetical protein